MESDGLETPATLCRTRIGTFSVRRRSGTPAACVSYHGQRIHFHSAGGDGSWSFNCGKFCVDSGIFTGR